MLVYGILFYLREILFCKIEGLYRGDLYKLELACRGICENI